MEDNLKDIILKNIKTPIRIQEKIEKYFDIGYEKLDLLEEKLNDDDYLSFIEKCNEQIDYLTKLHDEIISLNNESFISSVVYEEKIHFSRESRYMEELYILFLKKINSNKGLEEEINKTDLRVSELKEKREYMEKTY